MFSGILVDWYGIDFKRVLQNGIHPLNQVTVDLSELEDYIWILIPRTAAEKE